MKIEDVWELPTWGQMAFDPAEPRLFFVENRPDKRKNTMAQRIMVMSRDNAAEPVAFTQGPSDTMPTPSPDGQWLGFLSRRSGSSQVWRVSLRGGEPEQVTWIQGGIKAFRWTSDGSALIVVAHITHGLLEHEHPVEEPGADADDATLDRYFNRDVKHVVHQYYKLDGTGIFDEGRDQLVWVDLKRTTWELLTSGFDHFSDPVLSRDGEHLYAVRRLYDPDNAPNPHVTEVWEWDLATRERNRLPLPDWEIGGLAVAEDDRSLVFVATRPQDHGYGNSALHRWWLGEGRLEPLSAALDRPIGDESGTDVPGPSRARPVCRDGTVLALVSDAGRVTLTQFGSSGVQKLWDAPQVVYDFAVLGDEVALAVADPTHPSGIMWGRFAEKSLAVTWVPTPWVSDMGPVAPDELWAVESDGTRVQTWCLKPSGPGPHPTVLEIHGGPMSMYGYRYHHEFQCLVSAGYAVVYTNPRGSQGYGAAFCASILGTWGDRDYRDVMAGLDAALTQWPELDRERLGVAGGSYGGFMVNWLVSHTDRFRAAVTMRSVVNRFSAMGSSDLGWVRVPQYGHKPWWEDPEPYWQQSPLRYASAIHTPLLIEHQERDFRLPIEQGEQLYSALKYLGRTVEMLLYPDESHGMSRTGKPWHRVYRLRSIVGWFDRYLGQDGKG